jgi:predicted 2-oxoglutarate/Fe(II)-dependent dioxygenase YbiX
MAAMKPSNGCATIAHEHLLRFCAQCPRTSTKDVFNRYHGGQSLGTHVDNAVRLVPGTGHRLRTDLSAKHGYLRVTPGRS